MTKIKNSKSFKSNPSFTGRMSINTNNKLNTLDVNNNVAIGSNVAGIKEAPNDGMIVEGKVGIGTTRSVQVTEDGGIELVRYPKAEDWPATVTYSSYIDFKRVESDDFESRIQHIGTSGTHFGLRICTGIDNGFGTNEKLRIGEYGQIGITTDGYSGYNY